MKNYDEILENLEAQKKQIEAQYLKIEGAIEVVSSMKEEASKEEAAKEEIESDTDES